MRGHGMISLEVRGIGKATAVCQHVWERARQLHQDSSSLLLEHLAKEAFTLLLSSNASNNAKGGGERRREEGGEGGEGAEEGSSHKER